VPRYCHVDSALSVTFPDPCDECRVTVRDHATALAQLRKCDKCTESKSPCERFVLPAFSLDSATAQKSAMTAWDDKFGKGQLEPMICITFPFPEAVHVQKNAFQCAQNHVLQERNGFFFLEQLWMLFDDPALISFYSSAGVTLNAMRCRDTMATSVFRQRTAMIPIIKREVTSIIGTLSSAIRRYQVDNPSKQVQCFIDVATDDSRSCYFLGKLDSKLESKTTLFKASLESSPSDVFAITSDFADPTALGAKHGVLFAIDKEGIKYCITLLLNLTMFPQM
jgi:hypothetical protein